jgi:hypothetical protein
MHLLLALARYQSLSELPVALREDPLFALHGAHLSVSVAALAQFPQRRDPAAFAALLKTVLATINGWNRLALAFRPEVGKHQPRAQAA